MLERGPSAKLDPLILYSTMLCDSRVCQYQTFWQPVDWSILAETPTHRLISEEWVDEADLPTCYIVRWVDETPTHVLKSAGQH